MGDLYKQYLLELKKYSPVLEFPENTRMVNHTERAQKIG